MTVLVRHHALGWQIGMSACFKSPWDPGESSLQDIILTWSCAVVLAARCRLPAAAAADDHLAERVRPPLADGAPPLGAQREGATQDPKE